MRFVHFSWRFSYPHDHFNADSSSGEDKLVCVQQNSIFHLNFVVVVVAVCLCMLLEAFERVPQSFVCCACVCVIFFFVDTFFSFLI